MVDAATVTRRRSWWQRFRHDLSLRIEHRGLVLSYLIVERGLKGLGLLFIALYLAAHVGSGVDGLANWVIEQFNLDSGSSFLQQVAYNLVFHFVGISHTSLIALAAGSFLYGIIEAAESVGLILKRRWAEYLVVLATAFFIPLELLELARKPSLLKTATLVINIAVVIYLVRRKRLFIFDEPEGRQ